VDICFVPEQHAAQEKLPAVSGSSGHLVVKRLPRTDEEPRWPGQVFAEIGLDYEVAMLQYVQATQDRLVRRTLEKTPSLQEATRWRKEWEGRAERYQIREQRKQEELDWKALKAEWRKKQHIYQALSRSERREQKAAFELAQQAWIEVRQKHRETLRKHQEEDRAWHQRNRELKTGLSTQVEERIWLAVLVVTDNCTRQCLGLPLFCNGPKLTSLELTKALQEILPEELQFVISDQGTHFRSKAFADLAQEADFIHVPVYRHRPESNGIAERFVLTLKVWLRSRSWDAADALLTLLGEFVPEYNDRPHQGLAIPGLSPNEFANRIWLI
jgi:transposase InsO family protein